MRRILLLLLGLALIAAACGSDDDSATDEATPEATEESAESESAEEPTEDAEPEATEAEEEATEEAAEEPTEEAEAAPQSGGELIYGQDEDGTGFDNTKPLAEGAYRIANSMSDPLVSLTPDGDWKPDLAESLTPNEDNTAWTITLRPELTFHNGEPVDAVALKANLDSYRASQQVGFVFNDVASVEVVDDLSVEVTMTRPWAAFPYSLTAQAGWLLAPGTIDVNDSFVSTGPFMLESWTPGDTTRVVRNPDYWRADEGLPYLDAVTFKVIPEASTRRQALESGDIDVSAEPGSANIADFEESDEIDFWPITWSSNETTVIFNTLAPPLDDVRVRTALGMAIDRQLIIDNFRAGLTEPADSFFGPESRFWVENGYPEFDLAGAATLIDEYKAENGDVAITLTHGDTAGPTDVAEVIASFWEDAGVDVTLEAIGASAAVGRVIADDFQSIMWFQFGAPDPDVEYLFFHTNGNFLNWSNLANADFDAAWDVGREADDDATRAEAYAEVQRLFAELMPLVWLDHLGAVEGVAAAAAVQDIHTSTFVDGTDRVPMINGDKHQFGQIWLAQ